MAQSRPRSLVGLFRPANGKDSFPTLSSIFVETLCRRSFENGRFRQSVPTKHSDKDSATRPLGQALIRACPTKGVRGSLSSTLSAHFVENGQKPHRSTKCSTKARDKVG